MTSPSDNLFVRLHKWAWRQDENFLTESLAVVLEQLLKLAPDIGTRLIRNLTGNFIDVVPADASLIQIETQVETGSGRPDMEIATPDRLVWVEVKAESSLRSGQLEGYRVLLKASGVTLTRLVLLTRYPEVYLPNATRPDLELRWFEVAAWLEEGLPQLEEGSVAAFLCTQLLDFLRIRGMTLAQVGKYMPEGVRALGNLINMLFEAAAACKVPAKNAAGRDALGINLDGTKYHVAIGFEDPGKLWFSTRTRIDPEAARRLGIGEVSEESWVPGRYRWWWSVELESEEVHFFERNKVSQMQWLVGFLRDCLEKAHSIETADQPPIPEEPEGN